MELSIALTGFKGWTGITKMLNTKIFHFLSEEITFRGKHDTNTSDLGSNSVADNLYLKNFMPKIDPSKQPWARWVEEPLLDFDFHQDWYVKRSSISIFNWEWGPKKPWIVEDSRKMEEISIFSTFLDVLWVPWSQNFWIIEIKIAPWVNLGSSPPDFCQDYEPISWSRPCLHQISQ